MGSLGDITGKEGEEAWRCEAGEDMQTEFGFKTKKKKNREFFFAIFFFAIFFFSFNNHSCIHSKPFRFQLPCGFFPLLSFCYVLSLLPLLLSTICFRLVGTSLHSCLQLVRLPPCGSHSFIG